MKNKLFILSCVVLMVAGTFYSCSKDQPAPTESDSQQDVQITGATDINNLLIGFNQKFEEFKDGKLHKSGVKISKDSVIWYIDAAINFNYASGVYSFARLHRDTVYVEVQFDAEMKALLTEVFESYEQSLIGIGQKYYAITGEHKKFVMATVSDAGALPDGKRKLRIATLTGTGKAVLSEDFGDDESYHYDRDAIYNCNNQPAQGAPLVFEAMLLAHFNPEPTNGSRYYFVGTPTIVEYDYEDYKIDSSALLTNYLDYKIYAAHEIFGFTDEVLCLEYNQNNSGIHEMQFYYDHLKDLANIWLSQQGNVTIRKSFAPSEIKSPMVGYTPTRVIYHFPKFHFRIKVATYEPSTPYFPTE